MDGSDFSVYGEAKGEYTRQLCVALTPTLESYFLDMFDTAKGEAPHPSKVLWQFQTMLQAIPDWNQDKVLRETEKIQNDCKCDYLEELLTAVFIAHTKVLSAIRLTTKQKKLQITIPKLDHFLHRVLSDSARQLWTNVFLFADTTSIEKQKNLRQVAELLRESILQAIRGMLPVKNILREYLHEDDDQGQQSTHGEDDEQGQHPTRGEDDNQDQHPTRGEEDDQSQHSHENTSANIAEEKEEIASTAIPFEEKENKEEKEQVAEVEEKKQEVIEPAQEEVVTTVQEEDLEHEEKKEVEAPIIQEETKEVAVEQKQATPPAPAPSGPPIIHIDTKSSNVSFQQGHTFFSSDNLNANAIEDVPFAEAELKVEEDDEEDIEEEEFEEIDSVQITDEIIPFEAEDFT